MKAIFFIHGLILLVSIETDDYKFWWNQIVHGDKITSEDEKRLEEIAFRLVKEHPEMKTWAFFNEAECKSPIIKSGKFNEWAKALLAVYRGAKAGESRSQNYARHRHVRV